MTHDPVAHAAAIARDVDTYLRTQDYPSPPSQAVIDKFTAQCQRSGLSPLANHIHLISRKTRWVTHTGIDGFRYGGGLELSYAGRDTWWKRDEDSAWSDSPPSGSALIAKVAIKKILPSGVIEPTAGIAHSDWYDGGGGPWRSMQPLMLAKCAEALAWRGAYPARFGGLYTLDEMDQSGQLTAVHRIMAASTLDELEALVEELKGLSPAARDKARIAYIKRQTELEAQPDGIATSPAE